jgi:PAS domain S-box-containing protein
LYALRNLWYNLRMVDAKSFQRQFCCQVDGPWHLSQLFDCLPDTYFFAKDAEGRFVLANAALAEMYGLHGAEQMIGKTDYDFSPRDLADQYLAEDQRVMRSGKPIIKQPWLIPDSRGTLSWYLSSKIPLFGNDGRIRGIAGAMRDVVKARVLLDPYRRMEEVVTYVLSRYGERIEIPRLARLVHLSVSQFDRRFKRLFQMTPQQFITSVRVNAACRMLTAANQSIAEIALATGFYDQSCLTKTFRRQVGLTPTAYRRKYLICPRVE